MGIELLTQCGFEVRETQREFIETMQKTMSRPNKVSMIHADTGIGKTLGYLCVALDWIEQGYRVILATSNHALMRQVAYAELPKLTDIEPGLYYGKRCYPSAERIASYLASNTSLSSEDELYLQTLMTYNGSFDEFAIEYGELPDSIDENAISSYSSNVSDDVVKIQQAATMRPLVITTHATLLSDYFTGGCIFRSDQNTVLIIDEADAMIDTVEHNKFQHHSLHVLSDVLHTHCDKDALAKFDKISQKITRVAESSEGLCFSVTSKNLVVHLFNEVRSLVDGDETWQNDFRREHAHWLGNYARKQLAIGASKNFKRANIVISNPYLPYNMGQYLTKYHHAILCSGSLSIRNDLSGFDWVVATLGLKNAIGEQAIHSPSSFGTIDFRLAASFPDFPLPYLSNKSSELSTQWLTRIADMIRNTQGNVFVQTSSHKESALLSSILVSLPGDSRRVLNHSSGQSLRKLLNEYMEYGGIFITAAHSAGLDFCTCDGRVFFQSLFITRLGLLPIDKEKTMYQSIIDESRGPGSFSAQQLQQFDYAKALIKSCRRIKQVLGRAIRSPYDHAVVYICDRRFPLYHERHARFSLLRGVIAPRFIEAYKQASMPSAVHETLNDNCPTHRVSPEEILF